MATRATKAARRSAPVSEAKKQSGAKAARKSPRKAVTSVRASTPSNVPRLRIRMYRHGLGDCLLLRFAKNGTETFNILIDCGLIGVASNPKPTMTKVANDIVTSCGGRIDVVVMTHEHWDHASGFSSQQVQAIFDDTEAVEIGEVWYAWTEDPGNALGRKLSNERAAKVKALATAIKGLSVNQTPIALERANRLGALLGFFGLDVAAAKAGGATIGKTREAFTYLQKRSDVKTRYCAPKNTPKSLDGIQNVLVYVLGPPPDEAMLKKSRPTKSGQEVYEFAAESALTDSIALAFERLGGALPNDNPEDCPFDPSYHRGSSSGPRRDLFQLMQETWDAPGQAWRKIDLEWTRVAETLALNLDSHTNNTCLVLAFEFTDTGEVFLFPADAQIGNWLSWQDLKWKIREGSTVREVTGPDLLSRAVFYKVGHHGSHNATLREFGLEQMVSDNLTAFIPVFKDQAEKNRWHEMPFDPLVERLKEKTGGRLLHSDATSPPSKSDLKALSVASQNRFLKSLEVDPKGLFYELSYG